MTIEIPRPLIEYILLGSGDSRRQLQDSPILGDVWVRYSEQPQAAADLLITSHKDTNARDLAKAIYDGIDERPSWADDDPAIAPLQTFVAARLYFEELLRVVVPMTKWWHEPRTQAELKHYRTPDSAADVDGPAKLNRGRRRHRRPAQALVGGCRNRRPPPISGRHSSDSSPCVPWSFWLARAHPIRRRRDRTRRHRPEHVRHRGEAGDRRGGREA